MTVICLKSPHLSLLALTRRADSPVKSLCAFLSSLPHLLLSPWGSIQITTALVAFEQLGGLGSAPALVSLCMARSWGRPGEGAGSDSPQAGDLGIRQPKLGFPAKKEGRGAWEPPADGCAERGLCCHQIWLPGFNLQVASVGQTLATQRPLVPPHPAPLPASGAGSCPPSRREAAGPEKPISQR